MDNEYCLVRCPECKNIFIRFIIISLLFQSAGVDITLNEISMILRNLDKDNNGMIDYQ